MRIERMLDEELLPRGFTMHPSPNTRTYTRTFQYSKGDLVLDVTRFASQDGDTFCATPSRMARPGGWHASPNMAPLAVSPRINWPRFSARSVRSWMPRRMSPLGTTGETELRAPGVARPLRKSPRLWVCPCGPRTNKARTRKGARARFCWSRRASRSSPRVRLNKNGRVDACRLCLWLPLADLNCGPLINSQML